MRTPSARGRAANGHERAPRGWAGPERRLWAAACAGTLLDLGGRAGGDTVYGPGQTVSAAAVRTILTAGPGPDGQKRLRLRGARITGPLELLAVTCGTALILVDCVLTDPLALTGAELPELALIDCRAPELHLGWLTTAGSARLIGTEVPGPVYLTEARVGRRLAMKACRVGSFEAVGVSVGGELDARRLTAGRAELTGARADGRIRLSHAVLGDGQRALWLTGASCGGDLDLYRMQAAGVVNLRTATVGGRLVLDSTHIDGAQPVERADTLARARRGLEAILGEGLSTRGDLSLRYSTVHGEVRLSTAQIGGAFNLSGSRLDNAEGRALEADRSAIGSGLLALDGFTARGSVVLRDARIDGPVILSRGRIDAPDGRAFNASGLTSTGGLFGGHFTFCGQVQLTHSQIGGPLDLTGAELVASTGDETAVALAGQGIVVDGEVRATGLTVTGTVDLSTARVSGHLRMHRARFADADAPGTGSLMLSAATVAGSAELDGADIDGHVDLRVAKVTDHVRLVDAVLRGFGGRSLRGTGLRAAQLRIKLAEPAGGRMGLAGATVDVLADHSESWPRTVLPQNDDGRAIVLDGFTYHRIESTLDVAGRLDWLARATPAFEPGPYEQLAACYQQMGHERESRRVLREKTRRYYAAAGRFGRVWGWIQLVAVGYGYQPGRAVAWFAGLLAAGSLWFSQAHCPELGQSGVCPIKADEHPAWDAVLYTLDLLIPLVDIGHDKAWDPVGWDKVTAVALMAAGWVLVTTLVAAAGRALNRA